MTSTKIITGCSTTLILSLLFNFHPAFSQGKSEQAILDLSKKKFEWLINKHADSLNAVLDERLMFIHSSGWVQSKKNVLEDMISGRLNYKNVDVKEATVRLYGNAAIVTGKGRFSGDREGTSFDLELSYTEVYVLNNKKWLLVTRHANRMP